MKELIETLDAIRKSTGEIGCRPMLTALRLAAQYTESYAVKGGARAILNQEEQETLARAVSIMRRVSALTEKALAASKELDQVKQARADEFEQARRKILLQMLPRPSSWREYREVLLWRIAGDIFFNPAVSTAYFPDISLAKRDLVRCQQSHLSSLDNVVSGWWLEVHLYLSDNLWPRDSDPDPQACADLVNRFDKDWRQRAETMCPELVAIFDSELIRRKAQVPSWIGYDAAAVPGLLQGA